MTKTDFSTPAALYLGRDWRDAAQQGPRHFRRTDHAIRFAIEEAAPVSLHGALLVCDGRTFSSNDMRQLYESSDYPLMRKHKQRQLAAA